MTEASTTTTDTSSTDADNGGGGSGDAGREFTAPKDQAEFDRMVGDRLRREAAKYADYDTLKDKAGKFDELDAATKTETEKLTEALTSARSEGGTAKADALRFEIALDKGLTKTQAKRLVGSTREELEADAAELLKDLGAGNGTRKNVVSKEGTNSTPPEDEERAAVRGLFSPGS